MERTPTHQQKQSSLPMSRLGSDLEIGQCSRSEGHELQLISSCKCAKISCLFSSFDNEKVDILKSIGFAGLLKVPALENLNDDLSLWLYQRFDLKNKCIHLDGGVDLHIRDADVHLIFGIPFEGRSVHFALKQSKDTVNDFKEKLLSVSSSPCLTMSFLEEVLSKDYGCGLSPPERDAFSIASVLFSLCYLLAPEPQHDFPLHLIKNFVPDVEPANVNWAYLVLWTLDRASAYARAQIKNGSKKISLFGCSLLLQVFYVDNLNFGPSTPYHCLLPRSSAYSPDFLSKLILSDCNGTSADNLTLFGKREVRRAHEVCYTRGWQDHLQMQAQLERLSPDDYLSSIEILSEGLQLLDKFATQLNHSNMTNQYADQESMDAITNSYQKFRSKFNVNIHSLSTKAVDFLKRRNLSLHHHHIPQVVHSISQNRLSIGTSSRPLLKRNKSSGSPLPKRIAKKAANSLGAPIAPQVSSNPNFLGQVQHVPSSRSNMQAALLQNTISRQSVDDQTSSSNSQTPYSQRKYVSTHSNFPVSLSDLMFGHPDVSWENKYRCYLWMTNPSLPMDELNRDWITFSSPKALSIPGHVIQQCLKLNGTFNVSIVDAIMVLWNYLDEKMYNYYQQYEETHKIWRHFLPASFAEIVNANGDYLNLDATRASFIGDHITYNVPDCQKIILPVFGTRSWSCYFWDFKFKTITVLDPVLMNCPATKAKQKHHDTLFKLHSALFACKNHFFSGWDVTDDGWTDVYVTDVGHKCTLENSGLYAVHYARSFCSPNKLAFKLKEPHESTLCEARGEILHQLFTCAINQGYKPDDLMEKIAYFKI